MFLYFLLYYSFMFYAMFSLFKNLISSYYNRLILIFLLFNILVMIFYDLIQLLLIHSDNTEDETKKIRLHSGLF